VSLDYRPITPQDHEPVRRFLSVTGWAHRVGDPERFARMMQGVDRTVVVWDGAIEQRERLTEVLMLRTDCDRAVNDPSGGRDADRPAGERESPS